MVVALDWWLSDGGDSPYDESVQLGPLCEIGAGDAGQLYGSL